MAKRLSPFLQRAFITSFELFTRFFEKHKMDHIASRFSMISIFWLHEKGKSLYTILSVEWRD